MKQNGFLLILGSPLVPLFRSVSFVPDPYYVYRQREIYIQTGSTQDNPAPQHAHHGGHRRTYYNPYTNQYFYQNEDPMEDILRQFFGGGSFSQTRQRGFQFRSTRRSPNQQQGNEENMQFDWSQVNWMPLLQILLMFSMFLLPTLFSAYSMVSTRQLFSLTPSVDYPIEMVTLVGRIPTPLPCALRSVFTSL